MDYVTGEGGWGGFSLSRIRVYRKEHRKRNRKSITKGDFFSESAMCFSHFQNEYFKSLSWAWNLNKLFTVMGGKFKFQVQDSDLEYLFCRFDKHIALSEKKLPLDAGMYNV